MLWQTYIAFVAVFPLLIFCRIGYALGEWQRGNKRRNGQVVVPFIFLAVFSVVVAPFWELVKWIFG